MSGFTEETDCPKCKGVLLHRSANNRDPDDNYGYCLECGYSYAMVESTATLKWINEERVDWELPPLTELKKQIG